MRRLRELIVRLGGLFNGSHDRELDEAIASHLHITVTELSTAPKTKHP